MTKVVLLALLLGAGAVAYAASALNRKEERPAAQQHPSAPPVVGDEPAVGSWSPDPVVRPQGDGRLAIPGSPSPVPPQATAHADERYPSPEAAPEPPSDQERQAYAENAFDSQAFDSSWAPEVAKRLDSVASSAAVAGVRVHAVQCRTTLCKVSVKADSAVAGNQYVTTFIQSAQWNGTAMFVRDEPDARGAQAVAIYLARDDSALPEPPLGSTED